MSGISDDDVSLDGEYAREMFNIRSTTSEQSAALRQTPTAIQSDEELRLQAAKTSEEVFARYLESFKSSVELNFEKFSQKLSELDSKVNKLSAPAAQPPIVAVSSGPPPSVLLTEGPMEVDAPISDLPLQGHSSAYPGSKGDQYRIRKIDSVRFTPVDKLKEADMFKYWRRSVLGQLDAQDCTFVIDPNEPIPPCFSEEELLSAKRKVRYFIQESLDPYYQDLVQDISDPLQIMEKLQGVCDPSSTFQLKSLITTFNSLHFDPSVEKAVEFLGRFEDIQKRCKSGDVDSRVCEADF